MKIGKRSETLTLCSRSLQPPGTGFVDVDALVVLLLSFMSLQKTAAKDANQYDQCPKRGAEHRHGRCQRKRCSFSF